MWFWRHNGWHVRCTFAVSWRRDTGSPVLFITTYTGDHKRDDRESAEKCISLNIDLSARKPVWTYLIGIFKHFSHFLLESLQWRLANGSGIAWKNKSACYLQAARQHEAFWIFNIYYVQGSIALNKNLLVDRDTYHLPHAANESWVHRENRQYYTQLVTWSHCNSPNHLLLGSTLATWPDFTEDWKGAGLTTRPWAFLSYTHQNVLLHKYKAGHYLFALLPYIRSRLMVALSLARCIPLLSRSNENNPLRNVNTYYIMYFIVGHTPLRYI